MEREILVQVRGLREITLYNTYRCETSYMKFSLHIAHNPISSSEIVLLSNHVNGELECSKSEITVTFHGDNCESTSPLKWHLHYKF